MARAILKLGKAFQAKQLTVQPSLSGLSKRTCEYFCIYSSIPNHYVRIYFLVCLFLCLFDDGEITATVYIIQYNIYMHANTCEFFH